MDHFNLLWTLHRPLPLRAAHCAPRSALRAPRSARLPPATRRRPPSAAAAVAAMDAAAALPLARAVAHVDLDSFYVAVEAARDPTRLSSRPVGVVQYDPRGDLSDLAPEKNRILPKTARNSLIAVNHAARAAGVKRQMRGDEAVALCPDMVLVQVPVRHGKADLTLYRDAGAAVLEILAGGGVVAERASIDEAYLDLTEAAAARLAATGGPPPAPPAAAGAAVCAAGGGLADAAAWSARPPAAWGPGEALLAAGAAIVAERRAAVLAALGFTTSAGVAHTRLLAKLCSGLRKPAAQTLAPAAAVPELLAPLPLARLRGLGGMFGKRVAAWLAAEAGAADGEPTVGALAATPLAKLQREFGEDDGRWLAALARGVDALGVEERRLPKSVSCGKTFRGPDALRDEAAVRRWLGALAAELVERLAREREEHRRAPSLLTVGAGGASRSAPLRRPGDAAAMADDAAALVRRWAAEQGRGWRLEALSLGASGFRPDEAAGGGIARFFAPAAGAAGGEPATAADAGGAGADAAGPSAPAAAASSLPKAATPRRPAGIEAADVDEAVLAELPAEVQREVRMAMARARGVGGGGGGAEPAARPAGGAKRPAARAAAAGTLDAFLKGKRPKK
jgi:DNA polymerase eta